MGFANIEVLGLNRLASEIHVEGIALPVGLVLFILGKPTKQIPQKLRLLTKKSIKPMIVLPEFTS